MNDLIATEHPFTVAGMGAAPFRFVGFYAIPSPALAEKNPDGYNNALAAMPRGVGCGTCACCGMAITNNYIVRNSAGKLFAVGCDCIEKTGDAPLISRAEAQARANARAKRGEVGTEHTMKTETTQEIVEIKSETLSDGSVAWNVLVGGYEFCCPSERDAFALFDKIESALREHAV